MTRHSQSGKDRFEPMAEIGHGDESPTAFTVECANGKGTQVSQALR
jgi:hypothetical protein